LSHKQPELELIAKELLEKEIIFQSDLERLIGKRPFAHQTSYEAFTNGNGDSASEMKPEESAMSSDHEIDTKEEAGMPNMDSSEDQDIEKIN